MRGRGSCGVVPKRGSSGGTRGSRPCSRPTSTRQLVRGVIDSVLDGDRTAGARRDGAAREEPVAQHLRGQSSRRTHPRCASSISIRDGRDVAASLVGAADGWGKGWAPRTIKDAARAWVENVRGAQQYRKLGFVYREVRYEDAGRGRSRGAARGLRVLRFRRGSRRVRAALQAVRPGRDARRCRRPDRARGRVRRVLGRPNRARRLLRAGPSRWLARLVEHRRSLAVPLHRRSAARAAGLRAERADGRRARRGA